MQNKIKIRKAHLSDLAQIRQMFFEVITKVASKDYSEAEINVWASGAKDEKRWERKFLEQEFFVAEDGNLIIGFTSLLNKYYIDHLYVSHLHQGMGVASLLLSYVEQIAIKYGVTVLKSDVSITARPFFEKKGYVVTKKNEILHKGETLINFDVVKEL